eukprot:c17441_g1_i2.p1 GENE.c17441_g1_i2~~c17441_g1_i2.p1  ORF type:complete len:1071 (+),score=117.84 c17441_g1_i2:700-3912(+)
MGDITKECTLCVRDVLDGSVYVPLLELICLKLQPTPELTSRHFDDIERILLACNDKIAVTELKVLSLNDPPHFSPAVIKSHASLSVSLLRCACNLLLNPKNVCESLSALQRKTISFSEFASLDASQLCAAYLSAVCESASAELMLEPISDLYQHTRQTKYLAYVITFLLPEYLNKQDVRDDVPEGKGGSIDSEASEHNWEIVREGSRVLGLRPPYDNASDWISNQNDDTLRLAYICLIFVTAHSLERATGAEPDRGYRQQKSFLRENLRARQNSFKQRMLEYAVKIGGDKTTKRAKRNDDELQPSSPGTEKLVPLRERIKRPVIGTAPRRLEKQSTEPSRHSFMQSGVRGNSPSRLYPSFSDPLTRRPGADSKHGSETDLLKRRARASEMPNISGLQMSGIVVDRNNGMYRKMYAQQPTPNRPRPNSDTESNKDKSASVSTTLATQKLTRSVSSPSNKHLETQVNEKDEVNGESTVDFKDAGEASDSWSASRRTARASQKISETNLPPVVTSREASPTGRTLPPSTSQFCSSFEPGMDIVGQFEALKRASISGGDVMGLLGAQPDVSSLLLSGVSPGTGFSRVARASDTLEDDNLESDSSSENGDREVVTTRMDKQDHVQNDKDRIATNDDTILDDVLQTSTVGTPLKGVLKETGLNDHKDVRRRISFASDDAILIPTDLISEGSLDTPDLGLAAAQPMDPLSLANTSVPMKSFVPAQKISVAKLSNHTLEIITQLLEAPQRFVEFVDDVEVLTSLRQFLLALKGVHQQLAPQAPPEHRTIRVSNQNSAVAAPIPKHEHFANRAQRIAPIEGQSQSPKSAPLSTSSHSQSHTSRSAANRPKSTVFPTTVLPNPNSSLPKAKLQSQTAPHAVPTNPVKESSNRDSHAIPSPAQRPTTEKYDADGNRLTDPNNITPRRGVRIEELDDEDKELENRRRQFQVQMKARLHEAQQRRVGKSPIVQNRSRICTILTAQLTNTDLLADALLGAKQSGSNRLLILLDRGSHAYAGLYSVSDDGLLASKLCGVDHAPPTLVTEDIRSYMRYDSAWRGFAPVIVPHGMSLDVDAAILHSG